jgi:hypothetical protein
MLDVVARAAATLNSPEKLKQIILVNYIEGEGPKGKGYRYPMRLGRQRSTSSRPCT